jgi:hypothetical protein
MPIYGLEGREIAAHSRGHGRTGIGIHLIWHWP